MGGFEMSEISLITETEYGWEPLKKDYRRREKEAGLSLEKFQAIQEEDDLE